MQGGCRQELACALVQLPCNSPLLGIPQGEQSGVELAKLIFGLLAVINFAAQIGGALTNTKLQFLPAISLRFLGCLSVINVGERSDPLNEVVTFIANRNSTGEMPPPTLVTP